jgi:hypothetical protein
MAPESHSIAPIPIGFDDMAAKRATPNIFVLFDILYEDGSRTSNRKVPKAELASLDGDLVARVLIEAEDRRIGEMSGRPRGPIKSITRAQNQ